LAGFMREQVCVYMCPWPRIQAALTDEWALNVTYKYDRGEKRTSLKKARDLRAHGEAVGDCIDCYQCVAVCPTGIDIRDGAQLACIQCGLCIDACDAVMTKIGRPTRLIGYDNDVNIQRRQAGQKEIFRLVRPRTIAYAVLIIGVGAVMLYALLTRTFLDVSVLHDRNPVAVRLSDGSVRNGYTLRLLNKRAFDRNVVIAIDGVSNPKVHVVGIDTGTQGMPTVVLGPDQTMELRVLVTAAPDETQKSVPLTFRVTDTSRGEATSATDNFVMP
ncbi:MAG TPA: 4Fe-4S dicluster domain-containing protein, partial [Afipia sp.]